MWRKVSLGLLAALLLVSGFGLFHWKQNAQGSDLLLKLDQVVRVSNQPQFPCAQIASQHPIVILALGQSNAGNHGSPATEVGASAPLIADQKCIMAIDPLPGSTGQGGSIWHRLAYHLSGFEPYKPVVLSVMGIDATAIADWTDEKSPLREHLVLHLKSMRALGLPPQLVLWQQGEADARLGTSEKAYGAALDRLAAILDQAGSNAPIVMARSTICRSSPDAGIRAAMESKAAGNLRFQLGPDTDTLVGMSFRRDGCHFSAQGLDLAAQLWAATITRLAKIHTGTRYPSPIVNAGA